MLEIEVKIRVPDLDAVRRRLLEMGAVLERERYEEADVLFDFRGGPLKDKREALRLREAGRKAYLTFKGAPRKSRRFKIREELETEVRNPRHLRRILSRLGLVPVFAYAKRRAELRLRGVKICLDELEIGRFVELEGERQKIVRLARALGFPQKDWIKKDYVALLKEAAN